MNAYFFTCLFCYSIYTKSAHMISLLWITVIIIWISAVKKEPKNSSWPSLDWSFKKTELQNVIFILAALPFTRVNFKTRLITHCRLLNWVPLPLEVQKHQRQAKDTTPGSVLCFLGVDWATLPLSLSLSLSNSLQVVWASFLFHTAINNHELYEQKTSTRFKWKAMYLLDPLPPPGRTAR